MDWIKVADCLPRDGATVIAWAPDAKNQTRNLMCECIFLSQRFRSKGLYAHDVLGVTHWMNFPEPPYSPTGGEE